MELRVSLVLVPRIDCAKASTALARDGFMVRRVTTVLLEGRGCVKASAAIARDNLLRCISRIQLRVAPVLVSSISCVKASVALAVMVGRVTTVLLEGRGVCYALAARTNGGVHLAGEGISCEVVKSAIIDRDLQNRGDEMLRGRLLL